MISPELFIMQADRLCHEVFEHLSDSIFSRIEIKQFDLPDGQENSQENNSENNQRLFENIVAREQLSVELEKSNEKFEISESFCEDNKMNFFIIFINKEEKRTYEKYITIYEIVIKELFDYLIREYTKNNSYFYNTSLNTLIIRSSIDNLVTEISRKCRSNNEFSLYDNINFSLKSILGDLSSLTYEKNDTEGLIYFVPSIDSVTFQYEFENYEEYGLFALENLKLIRKLLELTNAKTGIGIISDTNNIYGIGSIKEDKEYFSVTFENEHKWTVSENGNELITVRNNSLVLINNFLTKKEFTNYASKIFPKKVDSENDEIANMYSILKSLIKQGKGTILVIKENARDLIQKYRDLCITIKPVKLDEKNVEKLSSIDGAIIMDENCICYGFGAVLDGLDTGTGNRARGSRFNSSERFYNLYKNDDNTALMVFILSDDGNFNLFPIVSEE